VVPEKSLFEPMNILQLPAINDPNEVKKLMKDL
jgi:hypothetical protein